MIWRGKVSHSTVHQCLCVIAVQFGAFIIGVWISFPRLAIPKMMANQTDGAEMEMDIDMYSGSWIVCIFSIGNIVGCFLGGFLNQKLVRCVKRRGQDASNTAPAVLCTPSVSDTELGPLSGGGEKHKKNKRLMVCRDGL
jgi:hypothetical protein